MSIHRSLGLATLLIALSGCSTVSYYQQAISGHLSLTNQRQPIKNILANPDTPARLQVQLEKVTALRQFADQQLQLPVQDHYSSYADLQRRFVVWNVFAAPAFSLQAKNWCYLFIGCADYRGYYSEQSAHKYAAKLQNKGMDVYVAGITAYSTLGWFKDPVLNTFVYRSDAQLANIIFHELAHQKLYIKDDSLFNESFATVVAREGVKRWFLNQRDPAAYQTFLDDQQKQQQFVGLVLSYREKLGALYASEVNSDQKQIGKTRIINNLRTAHQQLKAQWGGQSDYDEWFAKDLNNAQLNTVATYFDLVPALETLLAKNQYDLNQFYQACQKLKQLSLEQRNQKLGLVSI